MLNSFVRVSLSELYSTEVDYDLTHMGESLIVLQNPCTEFASGSPSRPASIEALEDDTRQVVYRVSLHCLAQASSRVRSIFYRVSEPFTYDGQSGAHLDISQEWDPAALLVILQIAHFRFDEIPVAIPDVYFLGKLVVIADYLDCLEILTPFAERWISYLKGPWNLDSATLPDDYHIPRHFADVTSVREATIWVYVCWRLALDEPLKKATISLVVNAKGRMDNLGLPFKASLLDKLDNAREERLQQFFGQIDKTLSNIDNAQDDEGRDSQGRQFHRAFLFHIAWKDYVWRCPGQRPYRGESLKENLLFFWAKQKEMMTDAQMESLSLSDEVEGYLLDMYASVDGLGDFEGLDIWECISV